MATKPLTMVRGRVARMTRLDGCGRVVYGDDSVVTTEGWISIAFAAVIDEGSAITVTNANGKNIVNDIPVARLSGYGVTLTFGQVDPDLFSMMTGQDKVLDAFGNVVGFDVDTAKDASTSAFALELWAGAPTQRCSEAGQGSFGYVLASYLQGGVLGDFTVENAAVTFTVSNVSTKDGNTWGVGPYAVTLDAAGNPSAMLTPITPTTALRLFTTELSPPEPLVGSRPLLDRTDPNVTSVTPTVDGLEVTFATTPSGADPWWIDFGDDTWDYAPTGGTLVHEYEVAGTYQTVAHRGTAKVTTPVTVTGP